jgi:hypothetical protein
MNMMRRLATFARPANGSYPVKLSIELTKWEDLRGLIEFWRYIRDTANGGHSFNIEADRADLGDKAPKVSIDGDGNDKVGRIYLNDKVLPEKGDLTKRIRKLTAADSEPTAPQLNMNGTSKEKLMEYWMDAMHKLREAIEVMQKQSDLLNGRDFVPQGGDNWRKARAEHLERMKKLQSVYDDVEKIVYNIHDQTGGR